jgi:hypothetical protein
LRPTGFKNGFILELAHQLKIIAPIAHNVPAVDDVFAARIWTITFYQKYLDWIITLNKGLNFVKVFCVKLGERLRKTEDDVLKSRCQDPDGNKIPRTETISQNSVYKLTCSIRNKKTGGNKAKGRLTVAVFPL